MTNSNEIKQLSLATIQACLAYFTGNARAAVHASLHRLGAAVDRGYWLTEDKQRSIRADLNKVCTAVKNKGRELDQLVAAVFPYGHPLRSEAWSAAGNLRFGNFVGAQSVKYDELLDGTEVSYDGPDAGASYRALRDGLLYTKDYALAFAPVAAAIEALDAKVPPPVFTYLDVSRTITKTLEGLGFSATSQPKVVLAPHHFEEREVPSWDKAKKNYVRDAAGNLVLHSVLVMVLDWPAGTKHGAGRFGAGYHSCQCESCGHSILNAFNWVPLLITTAEGKNYSLWVGRDCAKSLFGIKVAGEVRVGTEG